MAKLGSSGVHGHEAQLSERDATGNENVRVGAINTPFCCIVVCWKILNAFRVYVFSTAPKPTIYRIVSCGSFSQNFACRKMITYDCCAAFFRIHIHITKQRAIVTFKRRMNQNKTA